MPKLTYFAFFTILVCFSLALLACGDDPVSPPKDTTRPTVVSVSPLNGSSFVSVASDISVTFSEAMDQNTMLISSLTIDPAVTGAVSYTDRALTFDPDGFLPGDTTITVTVSTAAKDKAGNALASAYVWQFSTDLDSTPPTVLSTTPAAGAVDVPVSSQIIVRFSEDMAPSSACTAFQIDPVTVGTKTCPDSAMTFAPSSLLLGGQTYEVTMSTTATDTAGNALASDYTWQFTTFNDTSPPIGSIASPGDSAVVGTSTNITVTANDVTGVERVIFYVDGSEIAGSVDSTAPYEYTWTPTGLDTGSVHLITAEMFDVLGHSAFTDTVAVHYLWELLITDDDEELIHRDVNKVHVRSTGSLLEFRVETFGDWVDYVAADSLGINVAIYLDTDQNRATGDTTASDGNPQWEPPGAIGINDIGADYMIIIGYQGDILQRWTGSSWSSEGVVDIVNVGQNSNYFEVGVGRNRIGLPTEVDVVAFSFTLFKNPAQPADPGTYKWDWAPNEGLGHGTYEVDGSFSGKRGMPSGAASTESHIGDWPMPIPFD